MVRCLKDPTWSGNDLDGADRPITTSGSNIKNKESLLGCFIFISVPKICPARTVLAGRSRLETVLRCARCSCTRNLTLWHEKHIIPYER